MKTGYESIITMDGESVLSAIQSGKLSAMEVTTAYLAAIAKQNPKLNTLREVFAEEAITQATAIDKVIQQGNKSGPLAGLPIVIKENCDINHKVCSAGLSWRKDYRPTEDAWITQRFKQAGAITLGSSISDPGAFGVRTGEVTHPQNPQLTVGGSSGGSAAALAAHLCLGAIGTDTGGSIRIPSACCGTVGLKPTMHSLPMEGIFPLVESLDHVGPMARTVKDVDLLWQALAGRQCKNNLLPKRIGFDPNYIAEADGVIQSAWDELLHSCKQLHIECVEITLPNPTSVVAMHGLIFSVEAARYHLIHCADAFEQYPDEAKEFMLSALDLSVKEYVGAYRHRVAFTQQVNEQLTHVDLILSPTLAVSEPHRTAKKLNIAQQDYEFTLAMVRHTCLFNHTGHPVLSMPLGLSSNHIPPSLQIIGKYHDESFILYFAKNLESLFLGQ